MNVGIVCDELSFTEHGGSNYSIHRLATELTQRGHTVDVLTLNLLHDNDPPEDRGYNIHEYDIDRSGMVDAVQKVYGHIEDMATRDVLHIYYPRLQPVFGLWQKRNQSDCRMIGHLNSYSFCSNTTEIENQCWENCSVYSKLKHSDSTGKGLFGNLPVYLFDTHMGMDLMNGLDGFTALSPSVKEIYAGAGINEDLITVVPNMSDPTFPSTLTDGKGENVNILYAGRTDPSKGVDVLLEALTQVDGDYTVDIVGDDILGYGYGLDELDAEIEAKGLSETVETHGWVDYQNISNYYASADVFVHPGKWPEPFGRTLLEALQHDCAIVCSDTGAPPWVAGKAGVTFPKGHADILAYRLQSLVEDGVYRRCLQSECTNELERFNPESVTAEYEAVFQGEL